MANILIVDDEAAIADLIQLTLAQTGHKSETAMSGSEAADKLEKEQYDLVLLTTLMTAILFYFIMTYSVSGLAEVLHIRGSGPRRPPRAAMLFEYAAGVYALARLLTDFLPALNLITDLIAMIAMTVGFVMVLRFFATARPGNG